jgi:hypothetical protein
MSIKQVMKDSSGASTRFGLLAGEVTGNIILQVPKVVLKGTELTGRGIKYSGEFIETQSARGITAIDGMQDKLSARADASREKVKAWQQYVPEPVEDVETMHLDEVLAELANMDGETLEQTVAGMSETDKAALIARKEQLAEQAETQRIVEAGKEVVADTAKVVKDKTAKAGKAVKDKATAVIKNVTPIKPGFERCDTCGVQHKKGGPMAAHKRKHEREAAEASAASLQTAGVTV